MTSAPRLLGVTVLLLLLPVGALAQLNAPATVLGVPVQPAVPGVDVRDASAAAQALSDRMNGAAPGTMVLERPGRVLLGAETDAAPPRARGFMQPTFVSPPTAPVVPRGAQPAFSAGHATPGFFSMRSDPGPAALQNVYTAPSARGDPVFGTAP
ncbi:MAG: hypothetical protein M5U08_12915 [Burkholderiales bacterium]|nr:hypothetical protein [Burkholderiales bacterium]